jgi:hypothetical protein
MVLLALKFGNCSKMCVELVTEFKDKKAYSSRVKAYIRAA